MKRRYNFVRSECSPCNRIYVFVKMSIFLTHMLQRHLKKSLKDSKNTISWLELKKYPDTLTDTVILHYMYVYTLPSGKYKTRPKYLICNLVNTLILTLTLENASHNWWYLYTVVSIKCSGFYCQCCHLQYYDVIRVRSVLFYTADGWFYGDHTFVFVSTQCCQWKRNQFETGTWPILFQSSI